MYQDSISGHQTCVAFNSINDGHPGPPKQPFIQAALGYTFDDAASLNLCVSNTFASEGFFRNSLFSVNVGNAVFQNNKLELDKTIGGSWQHTWNYDKGNTPTIATLLSVQHPIDELDGSTQYQSTLIMNKNIAQKGVSYFNAFVDLPINADINYSLLAGYKFFVSDTNNFFLDVIYDPSDSITFEAALEINLPKGHVISPGVNFQRDMNTQSNIYGIGLFFLYQTQ